MIGAPPSGGTAPPGPRPAASRRRLTRRLAGAVVRGFGRLFPPPCVGCGRGVRPGRAPICRVCWHRLPRMAPPRCGRCGATRVLPVPGPDACAECVGWPDVLRRARSPFRMEGDAVRLVHALKYQGCSALAPRMGGALAAGTRELIAASDPASAVGRASATGLALVPVPLPPARLRERGYNQAELLARGLSVATGWAVVACLERTPGGRRQARLRRRDRSANVEGRFRPGPAADVPTGPVVLVDDVLTTGATAAACCRALAGAGADVLGTVTFARALHPLDTR